MQNNGLFHFNTCTFHFPFLIYNYNSEQDGDTFFIPNLRTECLYETALYVKFQSTFKFGRSLKGYAFFLYLTLLRVSLSLSLQNQEPPVLQKTFPDTVRPFGLNQKLLLIHTDTSSQVFQGRNSCKSSVPLGFLLLRDFGLSSPLCFHKSLTL